MRIWSSEKILRYVLKDHDSMLAVTGLLFISQREWTLGSLGKLYTSCGDGNSEIVEELQWGCIRSSGFPGETLCCSQFPLVSFGNLLLITVSLICNTESFMPWVYSSLCNHSSSTLVMQAASRVPQSFTSAGIGDMGGYGGGGSLPVNGLTAHQSQVGASSFSRDSCCSGFCCRVM